MCHGRHWIRYIASSSNRHRNLAYQFLAINLLFLKINFVVFISKISPQNFDPRKFPCALIRLPLFLCGTSSHLAAPCPHSSPTLIILKISRAIAIGSLQNRLKWDTATMLLPGCIAIGSFQNRLKWDYQDGYQHGGTAIGSFQNRLKWDRSNSSYHLRTAIGSFQNRLKWDDPDDPQ
ncbi:hypothetical protein FC91_GL002202 [Schleiferilactobacillus harbinensis DSM 16991]|uniref:Uncharacterized protein n=1 Tax=Schleiferilactobacillus harbinensis DSM 16991 TaxID=1122147 RepID=A0A0R1XCT9_9LACO|nr:hypothetical protein FC91_GL002202 [Schleiferilactobacillus harbinensis DSM 16991]